MEGDWSKAAQKIPGVTLPNESKVICAREARQNTSIDL